MGMAPGVAMAAFSAPTTGKYRCNVRVYDVHIPGSPFPVLSKSDVWWMEKRDKANGFRKVAGTRWAFIPLFLPLSERRNVVFPIFFLYYFG
jgi:hypothetical protein